jgi:predicted secreted protein
MSAEKSLGTTLVKTKSGAEELDLTVGYLTSIGRVGVESEEIDVTTHSSTDGYKEFIAGFKDAGELAISGLIEDEETMTSMVDLADSQSVEEWTITSPTNGSTWVFEGFVKMFEEGENTPEGVRAFNGTIRISGKPEYTSGDASA